MDKDDWLNTEFIKYKDVTKPCIKLGYCPYGTLVEKFPLPEGEDRYSCPVFGHHCPAHYHAEMIDPENYLRVLGSLRLGVSGLGDVQRVGGVDLDVEDMIIEMADKIRREDWGEGGCLGS